MYSQDVNIVYHCDDKYVDYMLMSMYSASQLADNLVFNVITNCTGRDLEKIHEYVASKKYRCNVYSVNKELFVKYNVRKSLNRLLRPHPIKPLYEIIKNDLIDEIPFTAAPLFFFALHKYLFDFNRYIFLDCDTIINVNLNTLYNMNLGDKIIGMIRSWSVDTIDYEGHIYPAHNGSVYVTDLREIAPYIDDMYTHMLDNLHWVKLGMQHSMNIILKDKIFELDRRWNMSVKHNKPKVDAYIYHYNTIIRHPEIKDQLYIKYEDSYNR